MYFKLELSNVIENALQITKKTKNYDNPTAMTDQTLVKLPLGT